MSHCSHHVYASTAAVAVPKLVTSSKNSSPPIIPRLCLGEVQFGANIVCNLPRVVSRGTTRQRRTASFICSRDKNAHAKCADIPPPRDWSLRCFFSSVTQS